MVTDPIADLLVRISNASRVGHVSISVPASKLKAAIATVLQREGYIASTEKSKKTNTLSIALSYKDGKPAVSGFKRVSKSSRRVYFGSGDLRPVKRGFGLLVLSTPAGILTGKEAREKHLGGEALFEIW